MPCSSLFLLGALRLENDGAPVSVETHKAKALLAYLAGATAGNLWSICCGRKPIEPADGPRCALPFIFCAER